MSKLRGCLPSSHPAVIAQRRASLLINRAGGVKALAAAMAPVVGVKAFRCGCGAEVVSHIGPLICSLCWARRIEARAIRRAA